MNNRPINNETPYIDARKKCGRRNSMGSLIKTIVIILLILLVLAVFQCDKGGFISGTISELVVGTEKLWDNTRDKIEEKRGERK